MRWLSRSRTQMSAAELMTRRILHAALCELRAMPRLCKVLNDATTKTPDDTAVISHSGPLFSSLYYSCARISGRGSSPSFTSPSARQLTRRENWQRFGWRALMVQTSEPRHDSTRARFSNQQFDEHSAPLLPPPPPPLPDALPCGSGTRERIWLSWSTGKDCAYALHILRSDKRWSQRYEVVGLLTTLNGDADRVAMHATRAALLRAQAQAVGLPVHEVRPLPPPRQHMTLWQAGTALDIGPSSPAHAAAAATPGTFAISLPQRYL